jgi:hypothetical protein
MMAAVPGQPACHVRSGMTFSRRPLLCPARFVARLKTPLESVAVARCAGVVIGVRRMVHDTVESANHSVDRALSQ